MAKCKQKFWKKFQEKDTMVLPGNGIFVVRGEMSILMTAMRRGTRWSSHSHQDEESDPLIKSLQDLKDILNKIEDLRLIEPIVFLGPFLEVVRSEDTTGPITSLALSAVNKFLSYGLIDPTHPTIPMTVHNIADAVTHARFVGTDQSSDGVVLMKILQVLRTLTLAPEGIALTNESLCEIMLSCFKICFETRLSELLRKTAEHYLKDMVHLVFMRLPQFSEVFSGNFKQLKMRPGALEATRSKRKSRSSFKSKVKPEIKSINVEKQVESDETLKANQIVPKVTTNMETATSSNIVDMQGSISQSGVSPAELNECNNVKNETEINSEIGGINPKIDGLNVSEGDLVTTEDSSNQTQQLNVDTTHQKIDIADVNDKCESTEPVSKSGTVQSQETNSEQISANNGNQDYVNPRGVRFTSQNKEEVILIPYGLACVRELFRFLISLCNPLDKQNTDIMIHLGLTLLTVAFEVGADSIGKYSTLLVLVKDELCRNLFSLLTTDRISVFAADLQISFLMFESLRTHLKFQLELYLTKLMEIIVSDSVKVTYEHKEIALDNILQLWRIPGFVTELYLNYDCNFYCTNLYEDLTKLLAKNAFPVTAGVYPTHLLSLDALLTVIESIESHCNAKVNSKTSDEVVKSSLVDGGSENIEKIDAIIGKLSRLKLSENVPSKEDLMQVKNIKKWLPTGTEYFNHKAKKGIQFLQEHGVLKPELDTHEIVIFLRENPGLDKKMIGEYISNRNNLQILETFVKMFDFTDTRIDEALRMYLESFRLPGEAPLISLLLEHFAEHWHKCNGEPFANADAAFTLAYAVIMLNVDQHNHNVKKQNNPMTAEEFKKNLKKVNGGADFDQDMLDEIYNAIKNEEIVMPAEQTGLVRENYLWKVLLRRGASKDGTYIHVQSGTFDSDLFILIWGPTVTALSFVYDKSDDANIYKKAILGFERCAYISSHFNMSQNLDMLILSLCKFTMLHNQTSKQNGILSVQFGSNIKAQYALKTVFALTHYHGDTIREGWKSILDLVLTLYSLNMLPKSYTEVEDFIEPSGQITLSYENVQLQKQESSLFSSLYSYMVSSENLSKIPTPEEQELIDLAAQCVKECNIDQLVTDSKFLHEEALVEMVKALVDFSRGPDIQKSLGYNYNESVAVFFLELLVRVVIQNRDRVKTIWQTVRDHLYTLVMNASHCDYQFLLERSVIGLLRLAIRLMRNEDMSPIVLQSLRMLLLLKSTTIFRISRQISFGLYELLKTSAQNIHTNTDWSIIFTLLECVGAGAQPPKPITDESQTDQGAKSEGEGPISSEEESASTDRGYTSDSELAKSPRHASSRSQSPLIVPISSTGSHTNTGGWILVGNEGEVQPVVGRTPPANQYNLSLERNLGPHDPSSLVKCCESLAFLVRDVAHITPDNYDDCIHCIRTFVEASLHESRRSRKSSSKDVRRRKSGNKWRENQQNRRSPGSSPDEDASSDDNDLPTGYHQVSIKLLDLIHTLHTRTAQIFISFAKEKGETVQEVSLWTHGWCPLLQGIARLCCDRRRQVRMSAITYLQRALLVHDLQTLSGPEWEACFHRVLFPLLTQLLLPIGGRDSSMEETRIRAATVLSKVFLHHLTPLLSLSTFPNLWLIILDFMDKYMHAEKSDLLFEAIPESLKNMLLVMDSAKVFEGQDGRTQLWLLTWERIGKFLPHMKDELFKEQEESITKETDTQNQAIPPQVVPFPKSTIAVTQHNIENATRSSIILQPPSSHHNINSPLFAHLGQMVSTPIGVSPEIISNTPPRHSPQTVPSSPQIQSIIKPPAPITIPLPVIPNSTAPALPSYQPTLPYMPNILTNVPNNQGHTFPVLYNNPPVTTTPKEVQPISLYSEYMGNPYNIAAPLTQKINENCILNQQNYPSAQPYNLPPTQPYSASPPNNPSLLQNVSTTQTSSQLPQQTPSQTINQNILPNAQYSNNSNDFLQNMTTPISTSFLQNVNEKSECDPSSQSVPIGDVNKNEHTTTNILTQTASPNVFQSSNYFTMSGNQNFPGSEILFGSPEKANILNNSNVGQVINIPMYSEAEVKTSSN